MQRNQLLIQIGQSFEDARIRAFFGDDFDENSVTYFCHNDTIYNYIGSSKKYFGQFIKLPKESFSFGVIRAIDFYKDSYGAEYPIKNGFLLHEPNNLDNINNAIDALSLIVKDQKGYLKAKKKHQKMHNAWKERYEKVKKENIYIKELNQKTLSIWKDESSKIKDSNKALKTKWTESVSEVKKANKALKTEWTKSVSEVKKANKDLQDDELVPEPIEPDYQELPLEPEYQIVPDKPELLELIEQERAPQLEYEKKHQIFGGNSIQKKMRREWWFLSAYDIFRVEGSEFYVFFKRREAWKYNASDLVSLYKAVKNERVISREDFLRRYNSLTVSTAKIDSFKVNVSASKEMLSLVDDDEIQLVLDEEDELKSLEVMPSLAPVKAMQAAAMLASGESAMSFNITDDSGDNLLVKTSPVLRSEERTTVVGGIEKREYVQSWESVMSMYNMTKREFFVYNN